MLGSNYLFPVTHFLDYYPVRGVGSWVYDKNDRKVLDLNSGQFCAILGHSDKELADCVAEIAGTYQDTNTATLPEIAFLAAEDVNRISDKMNGRSVFLSTGAEANECALRYAKHLSGDRPGVISFDRAYHGLTHGTEGYSIARRHVKPQLSDSYVINVPLSQEETGESLDQLEKILKDHASEISAALFEPIVSSGGMIFPGINFFSKAWEILKRYNVYLIFDEAQTGIGRTGKWFHFQKLGVVPDIVTTAKGLGGGYPASAVIFNGNTFPQNDLDIQTYSSHQNDPFACGIIHKVIEIIERDNLLESNKKMGEYFLGRLKELECKFPSMVKNARGEGMMCAFDIDTPSDVRESIKAGDIFCKRALQYGIMIQHCMSGKTIRLLPNYRVTEKEIDFFSKQMSDMLENYYSKQDIATIIKASM